MIFFQNVFFFWSSCLILIWSLGLFSSTLFVVVVFRVQKWKFTLFFGCIWQPMEKKKIYITCSNSCSIIAVLSLLYFAWSERVFTCVSERVSLCGRRFKSESQSNGFFVDRSRIWVASHSLLFPLPPFIRLCEEKKKKKRFPFCLLWLGEPVQSQGRYIQRVTRVISTSRRSH